MPTNKLTTAQRLALKTFRDLNLDPKTGNPLPSRKTPVSSHTQPPSPPFRIPALEKTQRQAQKTTGYKASAAWQTASLLRDLLTLWFHTHPPVPSHNLPLFSRLKAQLLDALRSTVANIEEGWARPSTREYLDFLGYSQASLTEASGDIDRMRTDGLLKSGPGIAIPTPSRNFPYPPVNSRRNHAQYGNLREQLREFTGVDFNPRQLTYDNFKEFSNKTNHLITKTIQGLRHKLLTDEQDKLAQSLGTIRNRYW
jgi:hypothetical protein